MKSHAMKEAPDGQAEAEKLLRSLPSVDALSKSPRAQEWVRRAGRSLAVEAIRDVLAELRMVISRKPEAAEPLLATSELERLVESRLDDILRPSLRPVINATGVILHTNLGRAPLAAAAIEHIRQIAEGYNNLEYDLAARARGKRDVHTARLLARVLGCEAAIVVNNCAAAVFLVLNALAKDGEVIVSRGELIEIGDGFRIPDIMAASGAALREVGTTNRTRLADYESAITDRTRLLLRVHPSNFRIVGFTERPALADLVELGRKHGLPFFEDFGSGNLSDLTAAGIHEPDAQGSLRDGADLVAFSGDKLLGGPQAGIIAGKRELVQRIRKNPLFRALRVDKLTIAALEATLLAYLREAWDEIPALKMARLTRDEIAARANGVVKRLRAFLPAGDIEISLIEGYSVIGGGSTPDQSLPTSLIAISCARLSANELHAHLHTPADGSPVIARVEDGRLLLDLRTVFPEQDEALLHALRCALTM